MPAAALLLMALLSPALQQVIEARGLERFEEATELEPVARRADGTELKLIPAAAEHWHALQAAARADGIELIVVSAFRSVAHQEAILKRKLDKGQTLEQILAVSAPPGYSEHHSGRALDLTTPGASPTLEVDFADTEAFRWLCANAGRFGFALSYPEGNAQGYRYEPWHWAWQGGQSNVPDSN